MRIGLSGQLTFADHQKFRRIIDEIKGNNLESLRLDFSKVDFIDSAGLGMLLLLRDECQNRHIALALNNAHGQVQKVFTISKFDQLFKLEA